MAKSYRTLRARMSPDARSRANEKARAMLQAMPLAELRRARRLSQEQIAAILHVKQASVSKLERRTDMYISTLRGFVKAMGGDLEIRARFPEGDVTIDQFEDIDDPQRDARP